MKSKSYKILPFLLLLINQILLLDTIRSSEKLQGNNFDEPSVEYIRNIPKENFYIIGTGDVLAISVADGAKELDHSFIVNGEGISYLKRLRKIYTAGLTIEELTKILNKEYAKYVLNPDVQIFVQKYRPAEIYLDGEVENPGIHILPGSTTINTGYSQEESNENPFFEITKANNYEDLLKDINNSQKSLRNIGNIQYEYGYNSSFPTVFDAIRKSGGVTNMADLTKIQITRVNSISRGSGRIKTTVNLLDAISLRDSSQNIRIYDGDTILVSKSREDTSSQISKAIKSNLNPKFIQIFVAGKVEIPGRKLLSKNSSLSDAFDIAGGFKAFPGKVNFIRYNSDGSIDKRTFSFRKSSRRGSFKNPYLKNGDIVFVGKSRLNVANEVIGEITSPLTNIISAYSLYKVFDD